MAPQFRIPRGTALFFHFLAACCAFLALSGARSALGGGTQAMVLGVIAPALAALAAFGLGRSANADLRANAAILLVTSSACVYGVEYYLRTSFTDALFNESISRRFALAQGRPYEERPIQAVAEDLSGKIGRKVAINSTSALEYLDPEAGLMIVNPGLPDHLFLNSRDSGRFHLVQSDEYGFRNPPGLWKQRPIQVLGIGDSFIYGINPEVEDTILGRIRGTYPNSLSVGVQGTAAAFYYVMFLEFAPVLKPKEVFIAWYEGNDVSGTTAELSSPVYSQYLKDRRPRGLMDKVEAINAWKKQAFEASQAGKGISLMDVRSFLLASYLRQILGFGVNGNQTSILKQIILSRAKGGVSEESTIAFDPSGLTEILAEARKVSAQWGGHVSLVYLPSWKRFCRQVPEWAEYCGTPEDFNRPAVMAAAKAAQVDVIDIAQSFQDRPDVGRLYYYPGSHYSETGNKVVADAIVDAMRPRLGDAQPTSGVR